MSRERIKIVVWDSIGNTLLGVRPWASWDPNHLAQFLAEDADAQERAVGFRQIFASHDVDLVWFSSPDGPHATFGALHANYEGSVRVLQSTDEIAAEIVDADYLVLHKERLPAAALEGAKRLRLLQHLGQDHRGVPLAAARALGVPVAATPLINYITVAEQVWAFILNWLKRLPSLREHMRAREYTATWGLYPDVKHLGDVTLGILGMGEIARPIARVAQAFDMPVIYWDIERFPDLEERYGLEFVEWDEMFRRSDVLTVQLALNAKTHGIIGEREIGLMGPNSLFINTARGKLVDQAALTAAVAARRIGGVAIDAFAEEPLPTDDPLLDLHDLPGDRVTLTPHNAWQSPWTWVRDSQEIWFNVRRSLDGEPIKFLV
ncbi:MAG: NAD(P)-dependent oxidoreductase [Thermomicrobiales bacterium]